MPICLQWNKRDLPSGTAVEEMERRLNDMGVPTFLITATVEAILAQRLVRRICSQCREPAEVHDVPLSE